MPSRGGGKNLLRSDHCGVDPSLPLGLSFNGTSWGQITTPINKGSLAHVFLRRNEAVISVYVSKNVSPNVSL